MAAQNLQHPAAEVPPGFGVRDLANLEARERELQARIAELEAALGAWQPIETLPKSGQALVTDDDPDDTEDGYCSIELVNCPMLPDGRVMNQNSRNYSRPGVWKWWRPVPPWTFEKA